MSVIGPVSGGHAAPSGDPPAPAAGDTVGHAGHAGFDPGLIDTLLRDHNELRQLFARIGAAAALPQPPPGEVRALLIDFKSRLAAHTLTENLRFYDVVYQRVAGDNELERMVHTFHAEMNEIESKVVGFVRQYQTRDWSLSAQQQFMADYTAIGKLFEHRISTEEDSLYRLYRQS